MKLAVVVLSEDDAAKLKDLYHLKIGMMSCRVRRRVVVTKVLRVWPPKKELQGVGLVFAALQMRLRRTACQHLHGDAKMLQPLRKTSTR